MGLSALPDVAPHEGLREEEYLEMRQGGVESSHLATEKSCHGRTPALFLGSSSGAGSQAVTHGSFQTVTQNSLPC